MHHQGSARSTFLPISRTRHYRLSTWSSALVVTLSNANTRVEGFALKDGEACAGAMVVLMPKNPAAWKALTRRDQSDSDGSFALQGVAPGEYTAIAIEDQKRGLHVSFWCAILILIHQF